MRGGDSLGEREEESRYSHAKYRNEEAKQRLREVKERWRSSEMQQTRLRKDQAVEVRQQRKGNGAEI
jgi:hypothetical protein